MSTEHDETRPVPTTPAPAPAQPGWTPRPADDATTPIPRPGAARTEDPTQVFDTPPAAEAARHGTDATASDATTATRAMDVDGPGTGGTAPTAAVSLGKPAGEHATTRTSAFAAAGTGAGTGAGGADHGTARGTGSGAVPPPPGYGSGGGPGSGPVDPPPGYGTGGVATAPAPAPTQAPACADVTPERQVSTTLRVGTVVWGLVLAIIGAGVVAIAAGAQFDLELAAIGLLALAGVALVVGSVVTAARRKR